MMAMSSSLGKPALFAIYLEKKPDLGLSQTKEFQRYPIAALRATQTGNVRNQSQCLIQVSAASRALRIRKVPAHQQPSAMLSTLVALQAPGGREDISTVGNVRLATGGQIGGASRVAHRVAQHMRSTNAFQDLSSCMTCAQALGSSRNLRGTSRRWGRRNTAPSWFHLSSFPPKLAPRSASKAAGRVRC